MGIKIDKDGKIIKDDKVVEESDDTKIAEDGTIIVSNVVSEQQVGNFSRPQYAAPISPLESGRSNDVNQNFNQSNSPTGDIGKELRDIEYDLMVLDGKIKGCNPTRSYIIAFVWALILFLAPFNFIGTAYFAYKGFEESKKLKSLQIEREEILSKKSRLEI